MKYTRYKGAILDFLRSKRQHVSAVEVFDAVREKIPNVSLGTIYRNLAMLIESGEIISVETNNKCVYYDGFPSSHAHFVCTECKKIFDFPTESAPSEPQKAGFLVEKQRVVYYGRCANCQEAKKG